MKKLLSVFLIMICASLTTSCWSRREIERLGFVMGLGISKTETGLYSVVTQVANPAAIVADAPDPRGIYTILKGEGLTVFDALRNLSTETGRRLYLAHIKTLVVDESVAKEGLTQVIGFLEQDVEVRLEIDVYVTKLPPEQILDTPNTVGIIPSIVLDTIAKNAGANSKIYVSDLQKTAEAVNNPSINFVTSLVEKLPKPTEKEFEILKVTKIAVFDNDRLKGYLDYEEGQIFNFLTNNFKNGVIAIEGDNPGEKITVEVVRTKTVINPSYSDGKIAFNIEVKLRGNMAEKIPNLDEAHGFDVEAVTKQLNQTLENKIKKAIKRAQKEYEIDYFNLSTNFSKKYPKEFKELKNDWNEAFSRAEFAVKVDSTIIHQALSINRRKP